MAYTRDGSMKISLSGAPSLTPNNLSIVDGILVSGVYSCIQLVKNVWWLCFQFCYSLVYWGDGISITAIIITLLLLLVRVC